MPAPQSRRAKIMVNLKRQLETILTTNNYATSVYSVTTKVKTWEQITEPECPILFLIDEATTPKYGPGKNVEWSWAIGVYGVLKNKDQIFMEELIADIEDCVFRNQTLSFDGETPGPAAQIRINGITTDGQFFNEIEGSQLFKVTLLISYSACANNHR